MTALQVSSNTTFSHSVVNNSVLSRMGMMQALTGSNFYLIVIENGEKMSVEQSGPITRRVATRTEVD
jgi:hypothetical protein